MRTYIDRSNMSVNEFCYMIVDALENTEQDVVVTFDNCTEISLKILKIHVGEEKFITYLSDFAKNKYNGFYVIELDALFIDYARNVSTFALKDEIILYTGDWRARYNENVMLLLKSCEYLLGFALRFQSISENEIVFTMNYVKKSETNSLIRKYCESYHA